jgi:hypothetical protein
MAMMMMMMMITIKHTQPGAGEILAMHRKIDYGSPGWSSHGNSACGGWQFYLIHNITRIGE